MSIASEITRLQTAKADIKSAIEAKGVTVPSNASIDTYDTYVSQISGGGGTNYLNKYLNKSLGGSVTSTKTGIITENINAPYVFASQPMTSLNLSDSTFAAISGDHFCYGCALLTDITVPTVCKIFGNNFCSGCTGLKNYTIPSQITTIGNYFLQASGITSITIPSTVTSLGNDCFTSCASLTKVIYNAPTLFLPRAFCINTDRLALVDLNSSVAAINQYSFSANSASTNLLEVVLRRADGIVTVANKIGSTSYNAAFKNRRNIKIYVPSALIASYEANENWAAGITKGYLTIVALEGSQYE